MNATFAEMNMSFQRLFTTVLLGALSFGCVASPPVESEEIDEQAQALEDGDNDVMLISTNGLPPGIITDAGYQALLAELAEGQISASTPLADTRDGRTLLAYLAVCALADDDYLISTASDGTRYRFEGHVALAPGWQLGAITASQGRWISACLLAHANNYALPVTIDLRGDHPALAGAPGEGFDQQEAGFYGDLFGSGDIFACIGSSPSDPDGDPQRVCGRTDQCRFTIMGACDPGSLQPVCAGGPDVYRDCEADDSQVTFAEVITVYTMPGTFGNDQVCSHSPDEEGWPLATTCSTTTAYVCGIDSYCCEIEWDAACVDLVPQQGL
jgi:hypothetical protein